MDCIPGLSGFIQVARALRRERAITIRVAIDKKKAKSSKDDKKKRNNGDSAFSVFPVDSILVLKQEKTGGNISSKLDGRPETVRAQAEMTTNLLRLILTEVVMRPR